MAAQAGARKASKAFYAALNRMMHGDAGPMANIWSHSAAATTMHPLGGREVGWSQVQGPWRQVASMCSGGKVKLQGQLLQVVGNMAYEVGSERGSMTLGGSKLAIDHRVTNVYRRGAGGWKIVHHHTDVSPEMVAVAQRLQRRKK
jgi:ketosteroid isomerase-like protein